MKSPLSIQRLKRRARLLSRAQGLALHTALDRVAQAEGYARWSLLVSRLREPSTARQLLRDLTPGDRVLIAARPGHGKTRLALQTAVEAAASGRGGAFFTLEWNAAEAAAALHRLAPAPPGGPAPLIDASDGIDAAHIIRRTARLHAGSVVAVDYLQRLAADEVETLGRVAQERGFIMLFVSQVDPRFEVEARQFPGPGDIALTDSFDLRCFNHACFMHAGATEFRPLH